MLACVIERDGQGISLGTSLIRFVVNSIYDIMGAELINWLQFLNLGLFIVFMFIFNDGVQHSWLDHDVKKELFFSVKWFTKYSLYICYLDIIFFSCQNTCIALWVLFLNITSHNHNRKLTLFWCKKHTIYIFCSYTIYP